MTSTPPEGIRASLANDEDVHRWNIVMDGPEGTSFAVSQLLHTVLALLERS